jgi:hypothetical protein
MVVILRPVGNIVHLPPYIISDLIAKGSISSSQALEIV